MDIDFTINLIGENDYDRLDGFSCGEKELDDFFRYEIKSCVVHHYLAPYCASLSSGEIVAAFTLMNDALMISGEVDKDDFLDDLTYASTPVDVEFFTRQHSFPAINIGHLGIMKKYQGQGIGTAILDFLADTYQNFRQAGCQFITVDAINKPAVTRFYECNGFYFQTDRDFYSSTRRMYRIL